MGFLSSFGLSWLSCLLTDKKLESEAIIKCNPHIKPLPLKYSFKHFLLSLNLPL